MEAAGAVAWGTAKHRLVPIAVQGRVSSLDWFISIALVPASFALTVPIAAILGARITLIGAGILGGIITWVFFYVPGVRNPERPVQHPQRRTDPALVPSRPPRPGSSTP